MAETANSCNTKGSRSLLHSMKISAKIISGAKENKLREISQNSYTIKVNQIAQDGKANEAVIELVADYFKVKKRDVKIISGEKARNKVIEIDLE